MVIAERLRTFREQKNLSQADIEKRTGWRRCYISRVENGHTVPVIETLEKMARAVEVPLYQLFYDGEESSKPPALHEHKTGDDTLWGSSGKDARTLDRFRGFLERADARDRKLLLFLAQEMARHTCRRTSSQQLESQGMTPNPTRW